MDSEVVAHASRVPLDMTRASLIRVCILPSLLPLSSSSYPSPVSVALAILPPSCAVLQPSRTRRAASPVLSSSKVDVGSSRLRRYRNSRFSAECHGCSRSCLRVCANVTERIPAEPRASGAGLLKDDWGLREDGMQRFLTSMVRRAA